MIFSNRKILWIMIPVVGLSCFNVSLAQDKTETISQMSNSSASNGPLQGNVQGVALLTQDGLVKIGESARAAQSAGMQLINEMNRKDIAVSRQPNVIGPGIVIPAAPNVTGTIPMGDLAPREKFVARFFNQLAYHVKLIRNEVTALILPQNPSDDLKSYWAQIQSESEEMQKHLDKLRDIVSTPSYDKTKASKEALGIYDESLVVNKLRKQIQRILKS